VWVSAETKLDRHVLGFTRQISENEIKLHTEFYHRKVMMILTLLKELRCRGDKWWLTVT
jgi:hypothetical protein